VLIRELLQVPSFVIRMQKRFTTLPLISTAVAREQVLTQIIAYVQLGTPRFLEESSYLHTLSGSALVSSQLKLHRYATGKESRVVTAMTLLQRMLWRYQGHISAALVLGGVDSQGAHLYTIYPHGSVDKLPYATMGSGSLAAMAVFEGTWKPGMERAEAMELVHQARYA